MPKAFKCSKCTRLFEGEPTLTLGFKLGDEDVELCAECEEQLAGWFDGHDVSNLDDFEQEKIEQ